MAAACFYYLFRVNGRVFWVEAYSESQALFVLNKKKGLQLDIRPSRVSSFPPAQFIRAGAKSKKKRQLRSVGNNDSVTSYIQRPEKLYRCNCGRDVPAGTCHLIDVPLEFMVPSIPED
jgi:hypothetical protein